MARLTGGRLASFANHLFRVQTDFKNRAFRFSGRQNHTVELDLQFDLGKNGGLFLFLANPDCPTAKASNAVRRKRECFFMAFRLNGY